MKVIITRETWLRGESPYTSQLLRQKDNKQCCLGFVLEQHGISRSLLVGTATPAELVMDNFLRAEDLPEVLITRNITSKPTVDNSSVCEQAMKLNDSTFIGEEAREANLTELFAAHGIELEFV